MIDKNGICECGEPLIQNLEEVLTVTAIRTSRICGIEYEAEDGEILFDYDASSIVEEDADCDTPAFYQCGFCGKEYSKATVVEVLKEG